MTTVGVVGAGAMGAGIAQVALEAGWEVVLHDVDEDAIERARTRIRDGLGRRAARLELDADSIDDWVEGRLAALREAHVLDTLATEATLVVEAVLEDVELKRTVFRALDAEAPPDVILATNTSALPIGAIAEATTHGERVIGLHFFNPVPVMALVEVVPGSLTSPAVVKRATAVMLEWGKTPIRCADSPGFIVNRVHRPYTIEALRLLESGVAGVDAIDSAMRESGFPMGPFELMDLAGIDVNLAAARGVWSGLGHPAHLQPSPIQERLVADGRLGTKSGRGFYAYADGRRSAVEPEFASEPPAPLAPTDIRDRILATVAAEARRAADDGVASLDDIVTALRLGAAYPDDALARVRRA
ncbi:MAG TPA: 3-hydroxyacyl-CoA dehydrogenase NAD-binding domain-containing protein [Candidatus Limnocylindrales bacterium]|nr:3-hydroxyacyl-CoA dehydrogenase NAD-binding domain-containing protein [Candidatus Limnocylindrales bacterium]